MYEGVLVKMRTAYNNPIHYFLIFENDFIHVNQLLDRSVKITFITYQCLNCLREIPIYRQGFCKRCFFETPNAGAWIIHPERSKAHLNEEDRNLDFEKKVQLQPHTVYLALSGALKVGVTRKSQIPTRWIDQGAHKAIEMVTTPNRYLAGITEVALKKHLTDKTNWQKMVTNVVAEANLLLEKNRLQKLLPKDVISYYLNDNKKVYEFSYPVLQYPLKPKTLHLEKTPDYQGVLKGIKGQYLLFEDGTVFNIRRNEGYVVRITIV